MAIDAVERIWGGFVRHGGFDWLATNDASKPHHSHEPCHGATSDIKAFSLQLSPDFPNAIDLEVLVEHTAYLDFHDNIIPFAGRQAVHVHALCDELIIGGRGNRQQSADRLDPEHRSMFIDERDHRFSGRSSSAWAKYAEALRKISLA